MASWQARATSVLLRLLFKPRLQRAQGIVAVRKVMTAPTPKPLRGTRVTSAQVGGINGEWIAPDNAATTGTLLYLHGGGYVACNPQMYRPVTCGFALTGLRTFAPDYRLAPEHPFPAALDDAVSAYRGLLNEHDAKQITVAGDSAGGGLCAALLLTLRERHLPLPAAAVLFSPFLDLAVTGESVQRNGTLCAMFTSDMLSRAAKLYVGDRDTRDPLCSPLYADLHGLPPLLIHVGADETLLDDSRRFATKAQQAGVSVELKIWPVVPHVWPLFSRLIPEGRQSLREGGAFLVRHVPSSPR